MTVLWANLFVVFGFSFLASLIGKRLHYARSLVESADVPAKPFLPYVFLVACSLIAVSGLRSYNIGDTGAYMHGYVVTDFSWSRIDYSDEFGFYIFQMALKSFSENPQLLIFASALVTNALIIRVLYKYSYHFELGTYLYVASGLFLVSMNGLRQFLASAILFAAVRFLFTGNWKAYFAVVLFASTIHQSALMLIPTYFIVRRRAWSWATMAILLMTVPIFMIYAFFADSFYSLLQNTSYGHYKDFNEGGANFLRTIVSAVPVVLAYLGRHRLRELWPHSDYVVNMALINCIVMLVATQNWIFARFMIYFGLYQVLLLAWVVKLFVKRDQKLVYLGIVACYLVYFYYEHVISLNIRYLSDYIRL